MLQDGPTAEVSAILLHSRRGASRGVIAALMGGAVAGAAISCAILLSSIPCLQAPPPVQSTPECAAAGILCPSGNGPLRDSTLELTEVLWIGPESHGIFLGSPSIVRSPQGVLLASHDFFSAPPFTVEGTLNATTQVLRAHDNTGGGVWYHTARVSGMYWAGLFAHQQAVWLLGVSGGDAALARSVVISRSTDDGLTWTEPLSLFAGTPTHSYHCAPTPTIVASDGRLFRAMEVYDGGRWGSARAGALLIHTTSADVDPLVGSSWAIVPPLQFDAAPWVPAAWGPPFHTWGWQEGSVVEGGGGTTDMHVMLRIDGADCTRAQQCRTASGTASRRRGAWCSRLARVRPHA